MKMTRLRSEKGFTIVELMIALTVLSTILVIATVLMIQIGSLYSKGVNAASLQNANRAVQTDVSSALQFSGNNPHSCTVTAVTCFASSQNFGGVTVYAFCIDTTRYSYVLGRELGDDPNASPAITTNHVLWRDIMSSSGTCQPLNLTVSGTPTDAASSGDGYEMVPEHVRLNTFRVVETPANSGVFSTNVAMAFGDSDLLCDSGTAGDCASTVHDSVHQGHILSPAGVINCRAAEGQQYCATSSLSRDVVRRIR
jgi:prepilin-type N-terminal cleavage/methylation domain-containing protein